jgi:hypothetical protein
LFCPQSSTRERAGITEAISALGIIRGTIADDIEKLRNGIVTLSDELLKLADQVAQLEAAVNVLRILAVSQLWPDDPVGGLKQLQEFEKVVLTADRQAPARQQALDLAELAREWQKHGKPPFADS